MPFQGQIQVGTGFAEVRKILNDWKGPKMLRALRRAQRAALRPVLRDAKRYAPIDSGSLRRAHKLRAAKRRRGRVVHRVTVGSEGVKNQSGVFYGGFQHWGWTNSDGSREVGDAWLKEAAERHRNNVEAIMVKVLREELEGV